MFMLRKPHAGWHDTNGGELNEDEIGHRAGAPGLQP
jgi:hypothetical protein